MHAADRQHELELLRFQVQLTSRLSRIRSADTAFRYSLRGLSAYFEADQCCLAFLPAGSDRIDIPFSIPGGFDWNRRMLTDFLRMRRPRIPHDTILAPIRKTRPGKALIAMRRDRADFDRGDGTELVQLARVISTRLREIDRERAADIRARIDRKIMEELRPKDLFYQILHGIRSLTHYNHSAALLIAVSGGDALELVAEQIAWRKGQSDQIGLRLALDDDHRRLLREGAMHGFDRESGEWREWIGERGHALATLCDFNGDPEVLTEGAVLCAPLVARDGFLGLLKVASQLPGSFGAHEVELVQGFLPQVAVALQNSRRTESLSNRILEAEKKAAVAALARGVSHDVNNALGSVLPLVQQIREDLSSGSVRPEQLAADLEQIEESLQLSRRIFAGMLSFARTSRRRIGSRDVRRAVEGAVSILDDSLRRRRIRLDVRCEDDLPGVRCHEGDLEQLLLNVMTNSRDAMPNGGDLSLEAKREEDCLAIRIRDTGDGISDAAMQRIHEPFFTTRDRGSGLGLSICNSIVADMQGQIEIDSRSGSGTEVRLLLPLQVDAETNGESS